MFILYGPGGVGKSSVVNILTSAVGGSITKLSSHVILVNPSSFSQSMVSSAVLFDSATSRMVTTADIEMLKDKILNMQTIKAMTGNDMSEGGHQSECDHRVEGAYPRVMGTVGIDRNATIADCLAATMFIIWTLEISHENMQNMLQRIGSDCCVHWCGMLVIARIKLMPGSRVHTSWYAEPAKTITRRA